MAGFPSTGDMLDASIFDASRAGCIEKGPCVVFGRFVTFLTRSVLRTGASI